jgi:Arc/MetJ family transcription regulator
MGREVRTNIVIDQELVEQVRERYGLASKREAVDFALRAVLADPRGTSPQRAALALEGTWSDVTDDELRQIYGDEWWGDR